MPNIEQYDSSINPESVISTKEASGVSGMGVGLKALGTGIEDLGTGVQKYQERRETGRAANGLSQIQVDSIKDIKGLQNSMSEEEVADYMKQYDAKVDALRTNTYTSGGSEFLEKQNRYTRDIIFNSLIAKNSALVGQEAVADYKATEQNLSTSVYNSTSQSSFEHSIQSIDDAAQGLSGKGEANAKNLAAESKRTLAFANLEGLIATNPDEAQKALDSGRYNNYVNYGKEGTQNDLKIMQDKIDAGYRAKELEYKQNVAVSKTQKTQFQEQNHQDLYATILAGTASPATFMDAAAKNKISETQYSGLMRDLNAVVSGTAKGDPAAFNIARQQITSGQITSFSQLTERYGLGTKNSLSQSNIKTLQGMYLNPPDSKYHANPDLWNALADSSRSKLVQPTYIPWGDRAGMSVWSKYMDDVHTDYVKKMDSGKYTPEQLLSPTSKDYIGNNISAYTRSKTELSKQAAQQIHDPKQGYNFGNIPVPPPGNNPQMVPISSSSSKPLTPAQSAAIESLKASLPKAPGAK